MAFAGKGAQGFDLVKTLASGSSFIQEACSAVPGRSGRLESSNISFLAELTSAPGWLLLDGALARVAAARQAFHIHAAYWAHNATRHGHGPAVAIRAEGRAIVVQHPSMRAFRA